MNKFIYCVLLSIMPICLSSCFMRRASHGIGSSKDTAAQAGTATTVHTPITDTVLAKADTAHPIPLEKDRPAQSTTGQLTKSDNTTEPSPGLKKLIGQVTPVWQKRIAYQTFSGKAKVHFDGPDSKQEFTANFRLRKDSVIWVNVIAIGLPVARILITRDSIFVVNYLQEEVMMKSLAAAGKILPAKLDFSSLQNLLLGEPLRDGTITDADTAGNPWTIKVEDSAYIQTIKYNKQDSTVQASNMVTRKPNGPEANTTYNDYEPTNKGKISTERETTIKNGNDIYTLDMKIMKADFDEPLDFPFTIPKNYNVK